MITRRVSSTSRVWRIRAAKARASACTLFWLRVESASMVLPPRIWARGKRSCAALTQAGAKLESPFFQLANQIQTMWTAFWRALAMSWSTRRKSYFPSSGSIQSHETPVKTVFMWTLLASSGQTTFMRSGSEDTVLLSSPASTRKGLPSRINCVAWPRFSRCGTARSADLVCAPATRAREHSRNAKAGNLRLFMSDPIERLISPRRSIRWRGAICRRDPPLRGWSCSPVRLCTGKGGRRKEDIVWTWRITPQLASDPFNWQPLPPAREQVLSFFRRPPQMLLHKGRQAVDYLDRLGDDLNLCGFQTRTAGRDCNCACRKGGTDGHTVDPAFGTQVEIVCRIDLAAIVAAAPDSRSGDGEVNSVVVGWAALAFGIDDFHVNQRHILPVGFETPRADYRREFDLRRRPSGGQLLLGRRFAVVPAHSLQTSGREFHIGKSKDISTDRLGVYPHRFAVYEQLHRLGIGNHVDCLHRLPGACIGRITPMAQDMDVGLLVLDDTVGEINLLGQPNGIHLAADPANLAGILPPIRVRIGEIDGRITRPLGASGVGVGNAVIPIG